MEKDSMKVGKTDTDKHNKLHRQTQISKQTDTDKQTDRQR